MIRNLCLIAFRFVQLSYECAVLIWWQQYCVRKLYGWKEWKEYNREIRKARNKDTLFAIFHKTQTRIQETVLEKETV